MQAIPRTTELEPLVACLENRRILVLSGAGISTDSGIPDYRGPVSSKRPRNPMRYQQFIGSAAARQRYWARSFRGWLPVQWAQPNAGHKALAQLETTGNLAGILTQNVDGLHQAAGSKEVLELHGSLARVRCLACGQLETRARVQRRMAHLNPEFEARSVVLAPDGDADVAQALIENFEVPSCLRCRGTLKPDVVFFGENVPGERVTRAWELFAEAEVLLVVGSSLTVFSGYRFVARAAKEGKPVAIINQGQTRGDACATVRLDAPLGEVLPYLAKTFSAR